MGKSMIEVTSEPDNPKVICPHCKQIILMDIEPFKNRVSKLLRDTCPKCGGEIFVGLLILCHPTVGGLARAITAILSLLQGHQTILGKNRRIN